MRSQPFLDWTIRVMARLWFREKRSSAAVPPSALLRGRMGRSPQNERIARDASGPRSGTKIRKVMPLRTGLARSASCVHPGEVHPAESTGRLKRPVDDWIEPRTRLLVVVALPELRVVGNNDLLAGAIVFRRAHPKGKKSAPKNGRGRPQDVAHCRFRWRLLHLKENSAVLCNRSASFDAGKAAGRNSRAPKREPLWCDRPPSWLLPVRNEFVPSMRSRPRDADAAEM